MLLNFVNLSAAFATQLQKIPEYVFPQLLFTTSEMALDYYHWKLNVRVASQVTEQLKIYGISAAGRAFMPTQEKKIRFFGN